MPDPTGGALILGGASLIGSSQQSKAAKSAAKQQAQGVANAQAMQRDFTNRAVNYIQPSFENARQALNQGATQAGLFLDQSGNVLSQGYDQAIDTLGNAFANARDVTDYGYNQARGDAVTGFQGAEDAIRYGYNQGRDTAAQGFQGAENAINTSYDQARNDISSNASAAAGYHQGAYDQGQMSAYKQAALNGLLGAEAQRQAYADFQASPGTEWLTKQQEKALLRNASALGGGLANQTGVQAALQENALGGAMQDYGNYYNRLQGITSRGDAASSALSGIKMALGQSLLGLETSRGQNIGNIRTGAGHYLSGLDVGYGQDVGNLRAGAGQYLSGLTADQYNRLAGIDQNYGQLQSGMQTAKAGDIANIYNQQAGLVGDLNRGLSQLYANEGTAIGNTYIGAGTQQAQLASDLGVAKSGGNLYAAQNAPAWQQALNTGLGTYAGLGGSFGKTTGSTDDYVIGGALAKYTR